MVGLTHTIYQLIDLDKNHLMLQSVSNKRGDLYNRQAFYCFNIVFQKIHGAFIQ